MTGSGLLQPEALHEFVEIVARIREELLPNAADLRYDRIFPERIVGRVHNHLLASLPIDVCLVAPAQPGSA